jgi:hypothetical protein
MSGPRELASLTRAACRYNVLMKVLFITVTLTVIYQMRYRPSVRDTYDKARDTFPYEVLVLGSAALACVSRSPNPNLGRRSDSIAMLVMQVRFLPAASPVHLLITSHVFHTAALH